jgi:hypothetical protein
MKMYGEVNVQLHAFMILALYGGELLDLPPPLAAFSPWDQVPGSHAVRAWLGPESVFTLWKTETSFSFALIRTPIPRASSQ